MDRPAVVVARRSITRSGGAHARPLAHPALDSFPRRSPPWGSSSPRDALRGVHRISHGPAPAPPRNARDPPLVRRRFPALRRGQPENACRRLSLHHRPRSGLRVPPRRAWVRRDDGRASTRRPRQHRPVGGTERQAPRQPPGVAGASPEADHAPDHAPLGRGAGDAGPLRDSTRSHHRPAPGLRGAAPRRGRRARYRALRSWIWTTASLRQGRSRRRGPATRVWRARSSANYLSTDPPGAAPSEPLFLASHPTVASKVIVRRLRLVECARSCNSESAPTSKDSILTRSDMRAPLSC